jgi:uncharacterized protein (DUF2147 family)
MQISNFLQKCFGIALVSGTILFGSAALISTINPAKADNPTTENSTGKIMMDQINVTKDGKSFYHTLVWDTETGKSKMYYLSFTESTWKVASNQLPSSPIY